jgi:importin subunit alpha-2
VDLEQVLKTGVDTGEPYLELLEEAGGYDRLESLQNHANERIYQHALRIMEKYLGVIEEDDENTAPNTSAGGVVGLAPPPTGYTFDH